MKLGVVMVDSVNPFQMPDFLPHRPQELEPQNPGKNLFEQASHIHAELLTHDQNIDAHKEAYHNLTLLEKIGQFSHESGPILTPSEERLTLSSLEDLHESLQNGTQSLSTLAPALAEILTHLSDNNPKAHLLALLTTLETLHSINAPSRLLDTLPSLTDFEAAALTREITPLLSSPIDVINHYFN